MTSKKAVQGHPQLDPYHLSRGHHKRCSCEPYFAQAGVLTRSLREQHLTGQGMAHSLASRLEDLISVLPTLFFSFFLSLFSQYLAHCTQYLAPDIEKNCPTAINLTSQLFEDLVTFYVYLCTEMRDTGRSSLSSSSFPFLTCTCG